jgi:hypothetical protein
MSTASMKSPAFAKGGLENVMSKMYVGHINVLVFCAIELYAKGKYLNMTPLKPESPAEARHRSL